MCPFLGENECLVVRQELTQGPQRLNMLFIVSCTGAFGLNVHVFLVDLFDNAFFFLCLRERSRGGGRFRPVLLCFLAIFR